MSWITIVEADVKASLNEQELEAYRSRIANGDSDPIPSIIPDVTAEVRGYVGTSWPLEASGIPQSLKNAAVDIIIYRLCKRVHIAGAEQRKDAADDAVELLKRVADGKHSIDADSGTTTGQGNWGSEPNIYGDTDA